MVDATNEYLRRVEQALARGDATEHTHRPALKAFIESLDRNVTATNEPSHVECGAPDFSVSRKHGDLTVGYVEAKDVGANLDDIEKSEQLKRYRRSVDNLMLTDYLEFRWYVGGDRRAKARLARVGAGGKLARDRDGAAEVLETLGEFLAREPEPITSPADLAGRMARLTHIIRDIVIEAFNAGKESDLLRDLRRSFAKTLIPDMDAPEKTAEFADMYVQTLAYGLFAARCHHEELKPGQPFRRLGAAAEIPKTNPFLRDLFEYLTGSKLDDEPYAGFVEDLVQVLAAADIGAVLQHFGKRTRREDPVVHFYETFLATYDPKLRESRGVYYTPEPVVSYIVRSVDHILKTRFGLPDGLADTATVEYERPGDPAVGEPETVTGRCPKVLILDPACGTGTFLYSVIDEIRRRFMERNDAGMWSGFVREHLLPRIMGFELLMAPYAVAHFKLGMELAAMDLDERLRADWAYDFAGDERLNVYLTNTLEEPEKEIETLFGPFRVITDEARRASEIKRDMPILVVMGNPPYSNFGMMNQGDWIMGLMQDWKPAGEKKWSIDDFMKFIRWGQWRIEKTGVGILALISNNIYIDALTHRQMRESLLDTFTDVYIFDLHGSVRKGEKSPDGSKDENVFDIQQGVCIGLFIKGPEKESRRVIDFYEIWGRRECKYNYLRESDVSSTDWGEVFPEDHYSFFVPKDFTLSVEYDNYLNISDVFIILQNGIKTDRDALFYDIDENALGNRMRLFYSSKALESEFRDKFRVTDSSSYAILSKREKTDFAAENIQKCLYRPFDERWIYYKLGLTSRPAWEVIKHVVNKENLTLITVRQQSQHGTIWNLVGVSNRLIDCCAISNKTKEINYLFPLYLYPPPEGAEKGQRGFDVASAPYPPGPGGRVPNLSPEFVDEFAAKLGLEFVADGRGDLKRTFGPEDVLHYIYAVFHSPTYRLRYAEFLRIDFPRVPLTSDVKLFGKLCDLGAELTALHLLESPKVRDKITHFPVTGDDTVAKGYPKYLGPGELVAGEKLKEGRVYINKEQYFGGVPPEVWEFYVGGYQVCDKWLKDRRGRKLTHGDKEHYQHVIVALKETIRLMDEIDAAVGKWPIV
jgi:predicted helicase